MACYKCGSSEGSESSLCSECKQKKREERKAGRAANRNTTKSTRSVASFHPAGFWIRALAFFLDSIFLFLISWVFLSVFHSEITSQGMEAVAAYLKDSNILILIHAVMVIGFWSSLDATPGKLLLGLKIIDIQTGGKASTFKLILRWLGYIPSGIVLNLGYIWVGIDGNKQGWHDKIAGTTVVYR